MVRVGLVPFLCKSHKELLNAEIRDVNSLQIIDTVLLKTYLQSSPSMISSLLRLKENFCLYNECEKLLTKSNKIPELVLLMKKANKAGFQPFSCLAVKGIGGYHIRLYYSAIG